MKDLHRPFALFMCVSLACAPCCGPRMPAQPPRPRPAPQLSIEVQAVCHVDDPWVDHEFNVPIPLHGSGVPLDHHRIATAEHVIANPVTLEFDNIIEKCPTVPDIHIVWPSGRRDRAYIESEDVDHDVAILRVLADTGMDPVEIAAPVMGDAVCASVTVPVAEHVCGVVEDVGGEDGADFHVGAAGRPGNSGGGVWDSRGRLIGLLTRGPRKDHLEFGATSTLPRSAP